ncbi:MULTISPECIES: hypothetical protein [Clostridium]|jgi:hypothetical protein|uniref:Uncharacterized protein n=1 Tax=Clostridium saccharoperbutylacetonicum N1-4(HMT) TaxID=931276 RepID=M1LVS8_9CLOT|nr:MULTISPECIES: hypothetical protein [Clostridium]AGF57250.1 hypothetical protein Cspa_c34890 [Clostridium saccharoperbutylacetonicum N1-4(HMT)]AQR95931.1 hypothetical protein CLSAP_32490 [Clostridium saccharoperbutylacetonicum]NRT61988.1 hypothetical protein [Clostridium saccharoperbutylacetonicum]NSB25317.1 hypothetical protein [Clostridium saccharoperbutylacetonicum]NSB31798.1 hypothetical protein [Clostridium saccharoperbutylacetonicum]
MLKIKDLESVLNTNMMNVIYEDHWNGQQYGYVDSEAKIELILPVNENTIKISVTP